MKIVFASTAARSHLNPILAIARIALSRGDDVIVVAASAYKTDIEAVQARFIPVGKDADWDAEATFKDDADYQQLPVGPAKFLYAFKHAFIDTIPGQANALWDVIAREAPDVIVADSMFCGTAPLMLDTSRPRPPIVHYSVTVLVSERPDGAPWGPGLPPALVDATRARYAALAAEMNTNLWAPVQQYANAVLAEMGVDPLPSPFFTSRAKLCDACLQPTVRSFEYDDDALPDTVRFIGTLPIVPDLAPLPPWWDEVDGSRRVVLVTQGTIQNSDFSQLIEPTLSALAGRDDLLVLVTTGGGRIEAIRGPIPSNARLATFLPFDRVMAAVDVLVTNGGYGTTNFALSNGVPIVVAGLTEDKAEVGTRIAWSGVGINIATMTPSPSDLRTAVNEVLASKRYLERAQVIAAEFASHDTPAEIFDVIHEVIAARLT
jgi:MGT family glycosyltransferase